MQHFDLIIIGAGPAGATLAIRLAGKGLRIGIFERDTFPRHKICGDALSGKVMNILKRMPGDIYQDFLEKAEKVPGYGIRFTSPKGTSVDLPFASAGNEPPGFICRRLDFDAFLFGKLSAMSNIEVFSGEPVVRLTRGRDHIAAETGESVCTASMVAGADGFRSVVRRDLFGEVNAQKHLCVGLRGYYQNVGGLHPQNYIELLFLKEILPAYLWIFPSTRGEANVGIGMLQDTIRRRRVKLQTVFLNLLHSHPLLSERFKNASLSGKLEAHTLPMGTLSMPRSSDRALLLGDAGFLVDPFSGEGIGNAMASGEMAADVITKCFIEKTFSSACLSAYDNRISHRLGSEFRIMGIMQKLASHPVLLNLVIRKASKNPAIRNLLASMYTNNDARALLTKPWFYASLFWK